MFLVIIYLTLKRLGFFRVFFLGGEEGVNFICQEGLTQYRYNFAPLINNIFQVKKGCHDLFYADVISLFARKECQKIQKINENNIDEENLHTFRTND